MRKLIQKKHEDGENGIAIMFSLIMLMIFFLIAFGFISMASSSRDAALAREPGIQASLSANESILNEALVAMETGLIFDDIVDSSKLSTYVFESGGNQVSVKMYGTRGGNTDMKASLPLQVLTAGDYTPDDTGSNPNWGTFGWVLGLNLNPGTDSHTDRYAWMVIESNGIDPNYVGGKSAGLVSGTTIPRSGDYCREMDIGTIDTTFRDDQTDSIYVNWSTSPPSTKRGASPDITTPWEDKKTLISSLSTSVLETAISLFEPNTSPVQIGELNSSDRYDLSQDPSGDTLAQFVNKISWLSGSSAGERDEAAANLKDFIDQDNVATRNGLIVGNERVPYLNEIHFQVINGTVDGDTTAKTTTDLNLTLSAELYNMYSGITDWNGGHGGSESGATAMIEVKFSVNAVRDGANITESFTWELDQYDLSSALNRTTGYKFDGSISHSESFSSTGTSEETAAIDSLEITLESVTLYGSKSVPTSVWDYAEPNQAPTTTLLQTAKTVEVSFGAVNPRDNTTNWDVDPFTTGTAGTLGTQNVGIFQAPTDENESGDPANWSTAYMPPAGKINHIVELGMCKRTGGKTFNLVDYNAQAPTIMGNYNDTNSLVLGDKGSFRFGDRSLLDYVYISSPGNKGAGGATIPSYQQYGALNPNTTNENALKLLLNKVSPLYGPNTGLAPNAATIGLITQNFPGINTPSSNTEYFNFDQFKDSDNKHNRNPTMYGFAFSLNNSTPIPNTDLTDAQREALVIQTMNLVSPKYSYFTILIAADLLDGGGSSLGSPSKIRAFVRRDNESGSYKIMKKTEL